MCRVQSGSFGFGGSAGAGGTGQVRDPYAQPSEQKLEMRPRVTASVHCQHCQQHWVALSSHWARSLVENILPGSPFSALKLRRAQVASSFYFIFATSIYFFLSPDLNWCLGFRNDNPRRVPRDA